MKHDIIKSALMVGVLIVIGSHSLLLGQLTIKESSMNKLSISVRTCPQCGKSIQNKETKYCSRECCSRSRIGSGSLVYNSLPVNCHFCGKETYKSLARLKKNKVNFCSNKCRKESSKVVGNFWKFKGDKAGYSALHKRLYKAKGKANKCTICGGKGLKYQWANMTGNYTDINDYQMMCTKCHHAYDKKMREKLSRDKLYKGNIRS